MPDARRLLLMLLAAMLLLGPAEVRADDRKARAGALFKQGNASYAAGDYVGALKNYRAARDLSASYKIDLNIAFCLLKLDRKVEAAGELERFMAYAAEAPTRAVTLARKRLDKVRTQLASVRVRCETSGAALTLDGKAVGRCPLTRRLYMKPGMHRLEATLPGHRAFAKAKQQAAGEHRELTIRLAPAPIPAPAPKPAPAPGPVPAPAPTPAPATGWSGGAGRGPGPRRGQPPAPLQPGSSPGQAGGRAFRSAASCFSGMRGSSASGMTPPRSSALHPPVAGSIPGSLRREDEIKNRPAPSSGLPGAHPHCCWTWRGCWARGAAGAGRRGGGAAGRAS